MSGLKFTKYAPKPICERLASMTLAFPIADTLYEVSIESDRRIKAGRLSESASLGAMYYWAVAKLATSDFFNAEHWRALAEVTILPGRDDDFMFQMFFSAALMPSIGGNVAWRASEAEQAKIIARVDEIAGELLELLYNSTDMDVNLGVIASATDVFKPLAKYSQTLVSKSREKRTGDLRSLTQDKSQGTAQLLSAALNASMNDYREPRLSDFLSALRSRIAGTLPSTAPALLSDALGDLSDSEQDEIFRLFGLRTGPRESSPPTLITGGNFGAYPQRKKALRTATIHAMAAKILEPLAEAPKFSVSNLIDALCMSWFGDSPGTKEIDTLIRPYRAEQENNAQERTDLKSALDEAEADETKVSDAGKVP